MADYKIPFYMMVFIAVKSVNRALSRIVHNNGVSTTLFIKLNAWFHSAIAVPRWTGIRK